ncbi:MAG: ATP-dependent helicase [Lachnospiraceae bacterium]|nr:ATP-dependent helicase [Lachnospiraceae bacterium]
MIEASAAQEAALRHGEGPAVIIAGPGSGKTFVIVSRLRYLISHRKIPPEKILTITFTKAAAKQMQDRAFSMLKDTASALTFGTFHSVFFSVLRRTYHLSADNILKPKQKYMIYDDIRRELKLTGFDTAEFISEAAPAVSAAKSGGTAVFSGMLSKDEARTALESYQKKLKEMRLIDFDDMLLMCRKLFQTDPKTLAFWRERFPYIQIDEFQDVSPIQYELVRLLSAPLHNLFVVGDDDQAIYGFRGASPAAMRTFQEDYPAAGLYYLTENYRSSASVVSCAARMINRNHDRIPKEFIPMQERGEPVRLCRYPDRSTQAAQMLRQMKESADAGTPYHEMAVLLRTNHQAGCFSEALAEAGIPFRCAERIPDLYSSMPARDIFAYLEFAAGDRSRSLFYKIMNKPLRYISRNAVWSEKVSFGELYGYYRFDERMERRIRALEWDIERLSVMKPYAAVHYLLHAMDYPAYLQEYAKEHGGSAAALREQAFELCERARLYESLSRWKEAIRQERAASKERKDGVRLLTMHGSKGLEFTEVFLPDLNEGIMPYRKAVSEAEIEEERRLLYGAMTRAKKRLLLGVICPGHGTLLPSRFIYVDEILNEGI